MHNFFKHIIHCAVVCSFLLLAINSLKANPIHYTLSSDTSKYELSGYFKLLEDSTNSLSLEEVRTQLGAFTTYQKEELKQLKQSTCWAVIELKNDTKRVANWLLLVDSQIDFADLYLIDSANNIQQLQSGRYVPYSAKSIQDALIRISRFQFDLAKGGQYQLLMKLHNPSKIPINFEVSLQTTAKWKASFYDEYYVRHSFMSGFLGFLGIMTLYNFFTFLFSRDKVYLYYAIYIAGPLLYTLNFEGFLVQTLVGESALLYLYIRGLAPLISVLFYLIFAKQILNTKNYPRINTAFKLLIGLELLLLVYNLVMIPLTWNEGLVRAIPNVMHLLAFITTLMLYIVLAFKRKSLANYFAIGAFVYVLCSIAFAYISITHIYPMFVGIMISGVGLIFEVIFFSLGLGYRLKLTEQAKRAAKAETARILKEQNQLLEQKVKERTQEIEQQKEEILSHNEELHQQQDQIIAQRSVIEKRNKDLIRKNEQITASIRYAKTIQEAVLPTMEKIAALFDEHFIVYRAKDIVSGDFYWMEEIQGKRLVAVVDCTGHGVPGAFMSIIGSSILNDEVVKRHVDDPAEILEHLHLTIKRALKQEVQGNQDGMDVGLLTLENLPDGQIQLTYAGAKRPLYYITPNSQELLEIKGDRRAIGGYQGKEKPFTNHVIELPKGSQLYLSSDGFIDQHNIQDKKFGTAQFKAMLAQHSSQALAEQQQQIEQILDAYMAEQSQRDDITLLGIKL